MKFYPSTDPRSPHYPGDMRQYNADAGRLHQIQILRELAFKSMDPVESRRLYAAADELAQRKLPIKIIPMVRQLNLFEEPRINGSDPETSSWDPHDPD